MWRVLHYAGRYETFWHRQAVGEAPKPGHRAPAGGHAVSRSRPRGPGGRELRRAVAASVSARPPERVTRPPDAGPPVPVDRDPEGTSPAVAAPGCAGRWAHDRVVDAQAHRLPDRGVAG